MTTIPDHYAALGIDPTADPEVITAAYRALAKKFHPDTGAAAGTADAARFDAIQQAYEVLRTPESRHAYDLALLEATERELADHIASKRRVAVRERERAAEQAAAAAAAPDLGDIRPEPVTPHRAKAPPKGRKPASRLPFVIPLVLVALFGAGGAWLLLPEGPKSPPLPDSAPQVAVAKPQPQQPAAETPPAAAPAAVTPAPAAPPPAAQDAAAEKPVFGSTATDTNPAMVEEAASSPEAVPLPDGETVAKSDKPVFGSSGAIDAPAMPDAASASAPAVPPLPKAKPAQPVQQAQQKPPAKPAAKTAAKTAPPKPAVQKQVVQQQPRARLAYQDPPQYYPEPDGYPPPGYEPPGYGDEPYPVPPGYEPPGYDAPPPGFRPPGGGPYRLVIWERQPGQQATAWSAGVVFKSMGKCTRQGVKAVLRRTGGMDPYSSGTRVWYECQQLTQR